MQKKAAVEISTMTLIGIAIAIPIFLFVILPIMQKALEFIIPRPDIITLQNYERLVNEIKELKEGVTYVPYFIPLEYKVVNSEIDKDCFPNNCLCLCSSAGCEKRIFEKECFRGKTVSLNAVIKESVERVRYLTGGYIRKDGLGNGVYLLIINKTQNSITIKEKGY